MCDRVRSVADGVCGVIGDGTGACIDDDDELSLSLSDCFFSSCSTRNAKFRIT